MQYRDIIENLESYKRILRDFSSGHVSHAYMIKSEDKKLQLEFALMISENIMCENCPACGKCRTCRNISALTHPDVFVYPKTGEKVSVADISEIISTSILAGMESQSKVYVLKNVDGMLVQVQNKLLKILEEPPRGVHFILLCENEDSVLMTVRSRVKQIDVEKIPAENIYAYLLQKNADEKRSRIAADSCDGNISKAQDMLFNDEYYEMYNDMFSFFCDFTHSSQLLDKSAILMKYQNHLHNALDILQQALRDAIMQKNVSELILHKDKCEMIKRIAAVYPQAALVAAVERINFAASKIFYNCNKLQIVENLLIEILEVRSKCLI